MGYKTTMKRIRFILCLISCCQLIHYTSAISSKNIDRISRSNTIEPPSHSFVTKHHHRFADVDITEPDHGCYDSETYRNPLNILLTCEHHRNTPCDMWLHLGLNSTEIETLLSSCPVSCNVQCR